MTIDAKSFSIEKLVGYMLDDHASRWRRHAVIISGYMPPFPRADTRPTCVVRFGPDDKDGQWLRCAGGPLGGLFWDIYGDDMGNQELALLALCRAPAPPILMGQKFYQTFSVPLRQASEKGGAK
jgi:hypothetical protein